MDHFTTKFHDTPGSQEIYKDLPPPQWQKTVSIMSLREWINTNDILNWLHMSQWVNTKIRTGTQDFWLLARTLLSTAFSVIFVLILNSFSVFLMCSLAFSPSFPLPCLSLSHPTGDPCACLPQSTLQCCPIVAHFSKYPRRYYGSQPGLNIKGDNWRSLSWK